MGFFKKDVQILTIDFYGLSDGSVRFETLTENPPNEFLTVYYFLTYFAKMLYNLGSGDDSYYLNRTILDSVESAAQNKEPIHKRRRLVGYKGKGTKTYIARWDKKGGISTKIPFGEVGEYAPSSVFLFLDYLNQTLPDKPRTKLFHCLAAFQNKLKDQGPTKIQGLAKGISKVSDIISWSSQIVHEAEIQLRQ